MPNGSLFPLQSQIIAVEEEMQWRIQQKDYPCVAALKSYHSDDFLVGFYGEFGTGRYWSTLRNDLLYFLQEQKKSQSIYLSFWAVFSPVPPRMSTQDNDTAEASFEQALWNELSFLTSEEDRTLDWPENSSTSDPSKENFCFSLGGSEFFVVGMHPDSSRRSRQFSRPVMIFNLFEQFEELARRDQYQPLVTVNRARDLRFQGSVNPMVEAYGEKWEAIQFSGKKNESGWKCPFHFLHKDAKKVETGS